MNMKTPLHYAARNNRKEAIEWLLEKGEINGQELWKDRDYKGRTALDLCLENNVAECEAAMILSGAAQKNTKLKASGEDAPLSRTISGPSPPCLTLTLTPTLSPNPKP